MTRWLSVGLLALLAGCSTPPSEAADASAVPSTAFDLAAVKQNFRDECEAPIVMDEGFCNQVDIARMTADGDILRVPTTLNRNADNRATRICEQLALAHFDGQGRDLGFRFIGILDRDGGDAAACSVSD